MSEAYPEQSSRLYDQMSFSGYLFLIFIRQLELYVYFAN